MQVSEEFIEGVEAFCQGLGPESNPYDEDSDAFEDWSSGYLDAEDKNRHGG